MLRLIFFPSFVRRDFQCISSCSIIPKYLTWDEALIFWLLMMQTLRGLVIILFLDLSTSSPVLLLFKGILFALIHSMTSFKSQFICLLIFFIDLSVRINFVSSVKWWTELNSAALCKLLINKINRGLPKTDT